MSMEDQAQELELAHWQINNTPKDDGHKFSPGEAGYGPAECDECTSPMPTERREWGYTICVHCKAEQERRDAQRGRY